METIKNFFTETASGLDIIFFIFIFINMISGIKNGFISSLVSFLKWILAFISVRYFLPYVRPYVDSYIKSPIVVDLLFGTILFFLTIFIILLINKGLKKTMSWTGLGSIDTFFGLIFGLVKGYVYFIAIFTLLNFIHPNQKWSDYLNRGLSYESILWGNKILIEALPHRYEYIDKSKESMDKLTK